MGLGNLACCGYSTQCIKDKSPASYDWRGLRYEWHPTRWITGHTAFDVESQHTPPPLVLIPQAYSLTEFLAAWTQAEVLSKLFGTPILHWIRTKRIKTPPLGVVVPFMEGSHPCWTFTDFWGERSLFFTCGWRLPTDSIQIYHPSHHQR